MLFILILYDNKNILYFNEDSGNAVFSCIEMGILNIDLGNINLDNNFDEEDPDAITLIRILAWHIKFEKRNAFKKTIIVELMPIARYPKRWWNFCMSENEKKSRTNFYWVITSMYKFECIRGF